MLLRLAQPPDPCGSQRLWLEHTVHMLGFEPGPPPSLQCPHVLGMGTRWRWGSLSPSQLPGEHQGA